MATTPRRASRSSTAGVPSTCGPSSKVRAMPGRSRRVRMLERGGQRRDVGGRGGGGPRRGRRGAQPGRGERRMLTRPRRAPGARELEPRPPRGGAAKSNGTVRGIVERLTAARPSARRPSRPPAPARSGGTPSLWTPHVAATPAVRDRGALAHLRLEHRQAPGRVHQHVGRGEPVGHPLGEPLDRTRGSPAYRRIRRSRSSSLRPHRQTASSTSASRGRRRAPRRPSDPPPAAGDDDDAARGRQTTRRARGPSARGARGTPGS